MKRVRVDLWVVAAIIVGVGLALLYSLGIFGLVILGGYAGLNAAGALFYCEQLRGRRARLQLVLRVLAVMLVPVGLVTVFLTPSGLSPSERSTSGSGDPNVRSGTSGASMTTPPTVNGCFGA